MITSWGGTGSGGTTMAGEDARLWGERRDALTRLVAAHPLPEGVVLGGDGEIHVCQRLDVAGEDL